MGTECLLPTAMPVHGDAYLLVILRRHTSSSVESQIFDGSYGHLLRNLSVMGGERIHYSCVVPRLARCALGGMVVVKGLASLPLHVLRSEEHTSELQSHSDLVCRLLLEKKKK